MTFFFKKVGKFRSEAKIIILDINIEYWDFDVVGHNEPCITLFLISLQEIESVIAMATVLNYNNTLKSINLNRPLLRTRQVSKS